MGRTRRHVLGGAVLAVALPGCFGTVGYQGTSSTETPTDSGGQAQLVGRKFNLNVEHRGEPDEQVTIDVLAKNIGDAPVEDVYFEVTVWNRDDERLEQHAANLDGLEAGEEWRHAFDLAATRDEIGRWRGEFVHDDE